MQGGAILAAGFLSNAVGIRVSSKLQLGLMALLTALLALAVGVAAPYARVENFVPFAPHGYGAVGGAASLLFFCFAGWEAVTHLAGEFRNPERDLKRATWLTLVVVGVIYIGLVSACVAVLGTGLAGSSVPVAELLAKGLGPAAAPVTAVAAAVLTFGPLNTFVAGAAKLGSRLASDGVLPRALARGAGPGEVPTASLGALAVMASISFALAAAGLLSMEFQIGAASACFTAVTAFGLAAGVVLLRRGTAAWYGVIVAAGVMLVVLAFSGWALLVPAGLAVAALLAGRYVARSVSTRSLPIAPRAAAQRDATREHVL
ncbi:APC family permease [Paenarthrobacter sp. S56]|uniref:APC family permease n=1 Tax=Paenarthrobacter sp. S56 TaxID=3138179 RepID=UPI00321A5499